MFHSQFHFFQKLQNENQERQSIDSSSQIKCIVVRIILIHWPWYFVVSILLLLGTAYA